MNGMIKAALGITAAIIVMAAPQRAEAQWVLLDAKSDAMVRNGLTEMYNLRYEKADSTFNELVKQYPQHPAGYFLLALVDWWRIVPNIDSDNRVEKYSKSFDTRIDKTLEICEARLEENPVDIVGLFFKGSALGYRARLKVSRNFSATAVFDWASALTEGKQAYDIILQCQRMAPSNSDILLGSGLYNYMAAYVPEKYPTAKPFISFLGPGDRQLGIQMLRISGQRAQYAGVEARYSLLEILSNLQQDYPSALAVAEELYAKYPNNPIFHKYLAKNYYMTRNYASSDSAWTEILRRVKNRVPGYEATLARQGLYYRGDTRLRLGRYQDAIHEFSEALMISKKFNEDESSWIVLSTLKLGYTYDLMGRRNDAIEQYEEVLSMNDYNNSHENAKKHLKEPYR